MYQSLHLALIQDLHVILYETSTGKSFNPLLSRQVRVHVRLQHLNRILFVNMENSVFNSYVKFLRQRVHLIKQPEHVMIRFFFSCDSFGLLSHAAHSFIASRLWGYFYPAVV